MKRMSLFLMALVVLLALAACAPESADITDSAPPVEEPTADTDTAAGPDAEPTAEPTIEPTVESPPEPEIPEVETEVVEFETEDGVTLSGIRYGSGTSALILSHGGGQSQREWEDVAAILADRGYLVFTYSFRGVSPSGGSGRDDSTIGIDLTAAIETVRGMGVEQFVLMGSSLGGTASAKVGGAQGAAALILLAPPFQVSGVSVGAGDLQAMNGPVLIAGTEEDPLTFDFEINTMFSMAAEPKELVIYDSDVHGVEIFETDDGPDLWERIFALLDEVMPVAE